MKPFFEPETVALIGASSSPAKPGNQLFRSLELTMGNDFYPVNARYDHINGRRCYRSITDVPAKMDVAVIFVPAASVPRAMDECGQAGVRHVIIESGGFAEVGAEGLRHQESCKRAAQRYGMRVWGPNCMGMINVHQMKVLSFMSPEVWKGRFVPGHVSLVVQSGMLSAGFLMQVLHKTPFGVSKIASLGNKMDVDEVEVLEYLVRDPETGVIVMYLESIGNGRRFLDLARETEKPVVVLKAGRTSLGRKAAASHTAALAQREPVLEGAFRQVGVIRVHGIHELMEMARCLGAFPVAEKRRGSVAILSFSGAAGVLAADEIEARGMELARFEPETMDRIRSVFPDWMDPENPLDLYPAAEKHGPGNVMGAAVEAVMEDREVDAVYAQLFAAPGIERPYDIDRLAEAKDRSRKPLLTWILGHGEAAEALRRELERRGIPVVDEIGRGVRILEALTMRR